MKNFPFIPLIMWTTLILVIINGHRVSRNSKPKVEYSMAAGVDAHLTEARKAFIDMDNFRFANEIEKTLSYLSKEAYCDKCIDKAIAKESLGPLVDIKHRFERGILTVEEMDQVFGTIITALAKNHINYTFENLKDIEDEFYIEDAIRHLKFSMKYATEDTRHNEEIATAILEEALKNHEIDEEITKKILDEVLSGI